MILKLKKLNSAIWRGHGFANQCDEWTIHGHEDIMLTQFSGRWHGIDIKSNKMITSANTRRELLSIIKTRLYGKD